MLTFWIARDSDGALFAYKNKPELSSNGVWFVEDEDSFVEILLREAYPEVTYENSPREAILTLK